MNNERRVESPFSVKRLLGAKIIPANEMIKCHFTFEERICVQQRHCQFNVRIKRDCVWNIA